MTEEEEEPRPLGCLITSLAVVAIYLTLGLGLARVALAWFFRAFPIGLA